jgi:hypothetical protein
MKVQRIAWRLAALPPVRLLSILRSKHQLKRWRVQHPGAPFANFYADRIEQKLSKGLGHTTLGGRGWQADDDAAVEWNRKSFAQRGLQPWNDIVALGLTPNMRCVDYGCGSLRLGQHVMRYLDVGNYYGIDVTDSFIKAGLDLIDPDLLRTKAPRFGTITGAILREIREWEPDFIFSNAVLQHVPPEELSLFFERLESMMAPHTRAFILYITGERLHRFDSMSWSYPGEYIRAAARSAAPSLIIADKSIHQSRRGDGRHREVLLLEGSACHTNRSPDRVKTDSGCAPFAPS